MEFPSSIGVLLYIYENYGHWLCHRLFTNLSILSKVLDCRSMFSPLNWVTQRIWSIVNLPDVKPGCSSADLVVFFIGCWKIGHILFFRNISPFRHRVNRWAMRTNMVWVSYLNGARLCFLGLEIFYFLFIQIFHVEW